MSLTYGHTFKENFPIFMKNAKTPINFKEDWTARPHVCDDDLCHVISRLRPLADAFTRSDDNNKTGIGLPFDGVQAIGAMEGPNAKGRPT